MPKKGCCRECKYADWDADGCTCMIDGRSVYNASDYTCDQYIHAKPLTNADRIRQMTDEELFDFLDAITDTCGCWSPQCDNCPMKYKDTSQQCDIQAWLKQEVQDAEKE